MSSQSQSIPDEALHRLLVQIQTTLQTSSRQLSLVRAQTAAKQREKKGIELTRQGIAEETKDGQAQCWQGVGKMFVLEKPANVDGTLAKQIKTVNEEIEALSKKAKFLEKQITEAQGHMNDFFRSGAAQAAAAAAGEGVKA